VEKVAEDFGSYFRSLKKKQWLGKGKGLLELFIQKKKSDRFAKRRFSAEKSAEREKKNPLLGACLNLKRSGPNGKSTLSGNKKGQGGTSFSI